MSEREKVIERIHEAIDMGVCVDLFMDVLELLKERDTQKFLVDENGKITPLDMKWNPDCEDCLPEGINDCIECHKRQEGW